MANQYINTGDGQRIFPGAVFPYNATDNSPSALTPLTTGLNENLDTLLKSLYSALGNLVSANDILTGPKPQSPGSPPQAVSITNKISELLHVANILVDESSALVKSL